MLLKARRALPPALHIVNACQAFDYRAVWIELGKYAFIGRLHDLYRLGLIMIQNLHATCDARLRKDELFLGSRRI